MSRRPSLGNHLARITRLDQDPIDTQGLGDVFDMLLAEKFIADTHLSFEMIVDGAGNGIAARCGELLEAGR